MPIKRMPDEPRARQRAALRQANEFRIARARLREEIRAGDHDLLRETIQTPTIIVRRMRISDLIEAQAGMGPSRARPIWRAAGVSPTARLGDLTQRQRDALCDVLTREEERRCARTR